MSTGTAGTADPAGQPAGTDERRREQRGWYFYDFACSVYSTSVLTVFLGPYLTSIAKRAADAEGFVHPLGIPVRAGSLFAYAVSVSIVVAVLVMPVVGAAADRTGRKKPLLAAAAYTGATATACMFFLDGDRYLLGAFLLIVANASISVSMALYNAYLPQIATPEERDAVSSRGWAFGYTSGAFVLVLNLVLYTGHDSFGLSESDAVRICIASAGVWWGPSPWYRCGGCATDGSRRAATERSAPDGGSCGRRCATCAAIRSRCPSCSPIWSTTTASRR